MAILSILDIGIMCWWIAVSAKCHVDISPCCLVTEQIWISKTVQIKLLENKVVTNNTFFARFTTISVAFLKIYGNLGNPNKINQNKDYHVPRFCFKLFITWSITMLQTVTWYLSFTLSKGWLAHIHFSFKADSMSKSTFLLSSSLLRGQCFHVWCLFTSQLNHYSVDTVIRHSGKWRLSWPQSSSLSFIWILKIPYHDGHLF